MKRILLTSLLFIVLIGASLAQTMTIHISGHVYNIANQAPIPNHQVFIFADSTSPPYFNYYNMVTTNANGFYEVMVNLTTTSLVMFHVQTYDCNNILHSAQATTANTQLIFNFNICATTPPPCSANFTFTPCTNSVNCFHFVASPINSTTQYLWTLGDGTTTSSADPHHTFAQAGTYTVCLKIWTANGCVDSICHSLTIAPPPQPCEAGFTPIPSTSNPLGYYFQGTSTGSNNYYSHWNFGDGTSGTGTNAYHLYAQPGTYTVCLLITNTASNCFDSICDTITVGSTPPPCSAGFAFAPCQNSLNCFHFEANAQNSTTQYLWTFDDGTGIDTTADPHHTFTQAGVYLVCLRIWTANGCQDSVCQSVTVGATPFYEIWGHVYAGSNILLDHGKARLFKVNNGINAAQLMAISTIDSNGIYHFNNIPAGTYYVKAKATPNSQFFGQYLPTYYPHNVHWINATPIIIPPTNNPYDINLKHVISPFGGPGMIGGSITEGYKLSESGPPAPDIDILLKPLTGDPYIYMESDINGAFNFDNLGYDTYEIYPEITGLTTVPAIITLNANNPAANNVNLVITPNQVAAFISDNGDNTNFFDIYPNPSTTEIKVEVSLAIAGEAVLSIYDLPGRLVFSERLSLPRGIHKLNYDLSSYENGSYIMQLKTSQGLLSRKFIVVK